MFIIESPSKKASVWDKKAARGDIMVKEMIAMLLAGGQGSRLGVLTQKVAKPAVSFGGKYQIIDFPLATAGSTLVLILWSIDLVPALTFKRAHWNRYSVGLRPQRRRRYDPAPLREVKRRLVYRNCENAIYCEFGVHGVLQSGIRSDPFPRPHLQNGL